MDLQMVENGDGGELVMKPNDLAVIDGFQNMIYLAMFGGNVKASKPIARIPSEEAFDWWGNNLLDPQDESVQLNSETERALNTIALTSAGRGLIQQAVEKDLAFMQDFATIVVQVSIVATDKVAIAIRAVRPTNIQVQDFIYIWDATLQELMGNGTFAVTFAGSGPFDFSFDVTFG